MLKITLLSFALLASSVVASPCPYANLARRDNENFQGLTPAQQLDSIWSKVAQTAGIGGEWPFNSTRRLFDPAFDLNPTMDAQTDEVPNNRPKLIHSVGATFKATFIPAKNTPYTGVFQGSANSIVRLSLGSNPEGTGGIAPGAAIKMFRENQPSANLFFIFNTVPQESPDFFAHDMSTHISPHFDKPGQQALFKRFEAPKTKWSSRVGTSNAAMIDERGVKVENPVFPFQVIVRPAQDLKTKLAGAQWNYTNTFDVLTTVPANTVVWNVYATDAPAGNFTNIGSIVSTSESVKSVYADSVLFFRHQSYITAPNMSLLPYWIPQIGTSWNWQLSGSVDYSIPAKIYASSVVNNDFDPKRVHANGGKAICYINVGSLENADNGIDTHLFPPSVIGSKLPGWPEKFLDIRSPIVRNLMLARFKSAKSAGCDAIEPDNTDPYYFKTGFGLSKKDARDYLLWMSEEVHALGMAIGLKNNGELLEVYPNLVHYHDFAVVESCYYWKECGQYTTFIESNKPVFAMEYVDSGVGGGCATLKKGKVGEACKVMNGLNFEGYWKDCELEVGYNPCQRYGSDGMREPLSSNSNPHQRQPRIEPPEGANAPQRLAPKGKEIEREGLAGLSSHELMSTNAGLSPSPEHLFALLIIRW
ncbi:hypothetical protein HDV05_005525 [Chytridiales sp. JEL 0842]|nr:hypothetical protein HDV05_005525 [Chytridiales sp. JEL 0842]